MVGARAWARDATGELGWKTTVVPGEDAFRSFGTLGRRRAYTAAVVAAWKAAKLGGHVSSGRGPGQSGEGPPSQAHVVDFEAITAGLPSDYCHDGEHWVSVLQVWMWYRVDPWAGRSAAAAEAANALANIVCPQPLVT